MRIPFFRTTLVGKESKYVNMVVESEDSFFQKKFISRCENWFEENHGLKNFFLTKSCTQSLELAAILLDIKPGDEIILPSYAFVSCGNAFAMFGAKCVFVDIHADSMNIDETKIEAAITKKTKVIVTLNYASVSCNYGVIQEIATRHQLYVVEDNAHGILAKYNHAFTGSFGDISTFSFDHMKNISCGQGGGISINNQELMDKFFIHYEFGTNRRSFFNKEADRYEWKGVGSNFQLSELNAAMLYAQLENSSLINKKFVSLWSFYQEQLSNLEQKGKIVLPKPSQNCEHNGHCFFLKTTGWKEKRELLVHLQDKGINAQFHYTPLHTSAFGKKAGYFSGIDEYTTSESQKLLRLPLYYQMESEHIDFVVTTVNNFFQ